MTHVHFGTFYMRRIAVGARWPRKNHDHARGQRRKMRRIFERIRKFPKPKRRTYKRRTSELYESGRGRVSSG